MRLKSFLKIAPVLLLCLLILLGCGETSRRNEEPTAPSTEPTEDTRDQVEELSFIMTMDNFSQLIYYPNLKYLDLSGSTCYSQIQEYIRMNPQVEVIYTVDLGGTAVPFDETQLSLSQGSFEYSLLLENLAFLPSVTSVALPDTNLTAQELSTLEETYPEIAFDFSITVLGKDYSGNTTELDLSDITPDQVGQAAEVLTRFPYLSFVQLMGDNGSRLSKSDVKVLVDAVPGVRFHYTFELFGSTISTDDEKVTFKKLNLTTADEPQLRAALDIMTGCDVFLLDSCGLSSEFLATIREDYTNTELSWRVSFGRFSFFTHTDTVRAVGHIYDEETNEALKYCRNVKYMDIGHNEQLSDLSFLSYMPDLEILIASGCLVSDLSCLENCKKLEFLELAYCGKLRDITPLAQCDGLKELNISHTKVTDLSPLDGLELERFVCTRPRVSAEEQKQFQNLHSECWTIFYTNNAAYPYGIGWRYDAKNVYSATYKKIREIFDYDRIDKIVAAQEQN